MNYTTFQREVNKGNIKPAYFFIGKENYFVDTGVQTLIDKLITREESLFNLTRLTGGDAGGLSDTLRTPPVFSRYRITIVKEAEKLKEQPLKAVVSFLKSPPRDGVLVLYAEKVDKRLSFYKQTQGMVEVVECDKPRESEMIKWMKEYVAKWNKRIDDDAVARLTAVNWPGMRELASELDRLVLMVGEVHAITSKNIEEMGGGSFAMEIWKLTDAVGGGDSVNAAVTLDNLQSWNANPTQVIVSLFRFMQKLWLIKWAITHRKLEEVRSKAGLIPFLFNRYCGFARNASMEGIEDGLLRILEADLNIKRGIRSGEKEIVLLVNRLTQMIKSGKQGLSRT